MTKYKIRLGFSIDLLAAFLYSSYLAVVVKICVLWYIPATRNSLSLPTVNLYGAGRYQGWGKYIAIILKSCTKY